MLVATVALDDLSGSGCSEIGAGYNVEQQIAVIGYTGSNRCRQNPGGGSNV